MPESKLVFERQLLAASRKGASRQAAEGSSSYEEDTAKSSQVAKAGTERRNNSEERTGRESDPRNPKRNPGMQEGPATGKQIRLKTTN